MPTSRLESPLEITTRLGFNKSKWGLLPIGCWLFAVGCWLLWLLVLAIGYWLLAIGYWLLAIGYWLLAIGGHELAGKVPSTTPSRGHDHPL
jgi:hypothetical protein